MHAAVDRIVSSEFVAQIFPEPQMITLTTNQESIELADAELVKLL